MPLNVEYNQVKDYETVFPVVKIDGRDCTNPLVACFGFYCMFLGIPRITEATKLEFYLRYKYYTALFESLYNQTDESGKNAPFIITMEMVNKVVGLRTNSRDLTHAQFVKQCSDNFFRDERRKVK